MRKKEREKKTQDLQKLITAADSSVEARKAEQQSRSGSRPGRRKTSQMPKSNRESISSVTSMPNIDTAGIKFPEIKASGASLRSQRMKLPSAVGQKKTKAIEQLLNELSIELHPMPTEEICHHFNELRSDMVLLYELKMALANCEYELQALKHQYEASQPGKTLDIPANLLPLPTPEIKPPTGEIISPPKKISEVIDLGSGPGTPNVVTIIFKLFIFINFCVISAQKKSRYRTIESDEEVEEELAFHSLINCSLTFTSLPNVRSNNSEKGLIVYQHLSKYELITTSK